MLFPEILQKNIAKTLPIIFREKKTNPVKIAAGHHKNFTSKDNGKNK